MALNSQLSTISSMRLINGANGLSDMAEGLGSRPGTSV